MNITKYMVKQNHKHDCGKAVLRMLLASVHRNKNYLNMPCTAKIDNFLSIRREAQKHGLELTGYTFKSFNLDSYEGFFILQIHSGGSNHFLLGYKKRTGIQINDPNGESYKIHIKSLNKYIISNILVVNCVETLAVRPFVNFRTPFVLILTYAFFILLLVFAFAFIREDNNYISYTLFTLAAIAKILEQRLIVMRFMRFEKKKISDKLTKINNKVSEHFTSYETARRIVFSYKYKLFTKLVTTLIISVILVFNNLSLSVVIIFLLVVSFFKCRSQLLQTSSRWEISMLLDKMYAADKVKRRSLYDEVMTKTTQVAQRQTYVSTIIYFILGIFVFLLMNFTDTFTLNYFMFYYCGFCYFYSEIQTVLTMLMNKSAYYQSINILID